MFLATVQFSKRLLREHYLCLVNLCRLALFIQVNDVGTKMIFRCLCVVYSRW